jgi:3-hydroxyisobutyrate dehydrogenase
MIAFLGMGLLGSNFVRALLKRGEAVNVWNRTVAKATALESAGAKAFSEVSDAVRGAGRVHLTLSDDAAVDDVLEKALPGFTRGAIIVDHTTTSAHGVPARIERWEKRGVAYVHAPVFMGPQNALDGTGFMLVSGERSLFDALEPALLPMTGKLVYCGDTPERAAGLKLIGNLMLMAISSGVADCFALGKALGIPSADVISMFDWFNPGASVPVRMKRLLSVDYSKPSWELAMARKDVRLMVEEAGRAGVALTLPPALGKLMDEAIEQGHAHEDWTVITKNAVR